MRDLTPSVPIGSRKVGPGHPVFVIAEIGINHNGSLELAKRLIDGAARAGADAVKFQKRVPELCVPKDQWRVERDTPWGRMPYIEYRQRLEFGAGEYCEIDRFCRARGVLWTASCWDEPSVEFVEEFAPPFYKIASASLTDLPLIRKVASTGRPVILSTGMSTSDEIATAVKAVESAMTEPRVQLLIAHCTSTYPCILEELNLRAIQTLMTRYQRYPVGYSGHETGLAPSLAAVALGASFLERHVTLDRAMWGTDQAASVEIGGFERLVNNVRDIETALGDGVKRLYQSELEPRYKLRRVRQGNAG